jgi:hypothetical protein
VPTQREPKRPSSRPLTVEQILQWADAHHARTGAWPNVSSGEIPETGGETWRNVYQALYHGHRGHPGGSSLARLLAEHRGVRNRMASPLTKKQILEWADAHRRRTGKWPNQYSGRVVGCPGEAWRSIHRSLQRGDRGLPGGESLAGLLHQRRGARGKNQKRRLTVAQILAWADAHCRRFKRWPNNTCGHVVGTLDESWRNIDAALKNGSRGLPRGNSLAKLLTEHRGVNPRNSRPQLSVAQVLAWADAHRARTGDWPTGNSGLIEGTDGETWKSLAESIRAGRRGFQAGMTLASLLEVHRGRPYPGHRPRLTIRQILAWADAHRRRTGRWPNVTSGEVHEAPGEKWRNIDAFLRKGHRGLRGGTSLAKLLAQRRDMRNRSGLPRLTTRQILRWMENHRRRTGSWPHRRSGKVLDAPDETWRQIEDSLRNGHRGLPGNLSLARLRGEGRRTKR